MFSMKKIIYRIQEIGEVCGGGTPRTTISEYWNGDIPWISPDDLTDYKSVYIKNGKNFITKLGYKNSSTKMLPKGTLLFSSRAPIGYIAIAENPICTNQGFKSIILNDKVNNLYFYYWLKCNLNYIKLFGNGATFPEISGSRMKRIKVEIFENIEYQQKIAMILRKYDQLIENNNKRIKLLEQMAAELYKEWFVKFRFPGYENTYVENAIPNGWKYVNLFEIGNVIYGFPFDSSKFCDDDSLNPVVRIRDIPGNNTFTYTSEVCDSKYIIKKNDILVGMDGIFHMCLWNGEYALLNQRVVKINSKKKDFSELLLYLSIYDQIKFWEATLCGTTVSHLGDKHLKRMKVLLPPKEVLVKTNNIFTNIMNEKANLLAKNKKLTKQRDSLLPRLMSGKIDLEDKEVI